MLRIDHLVIAVADPDAAAAELRRARLAGDRRRRVTTQGPATACLLLARLSRS
jgi:hypothetical protein